MPEIKIGIQLDYLGQAFRDAITAASQLGVSAVEINARKHLNPYHMTETAIRQLRKMLSDANLKVCALSFPTRGGYNQLERLHERVEATKAAMDLSYKLGAAVVVNQIGRVPEEAEGPEWDMLVDVLTELGKHAQRCGAFLAAETGSESSETLAKLLATVPEGSLGVALNPGKLIVNGFSAAEAVNDLGRDIMYVHASDGVRDLARGRGLEVELGRGSVDFPQLIGALEEHGYRGYFTLAKEHSDNPLREASLAIEYLRSI